MLKGAATFTKFKTESFGDLMADYIANKMREGLRNQGPFPGAPTWPPGSPIETDKMYAYWYERSEEHTSELQSLVNLVCRLLLEKKKKY